MLFGKHVNKYYFKYLLYILVGAAALIFVDIAQLEVPELFAALIDGINENTLTMSLLNQILKKMIIIILIMFSCRFLWRISLFGMAIKLEADLRLCMFKKIETLDQEYFSDNKTGAIMVLFTNDLQTIRGCFGQGFLMLVDALFLGVLSFLKMFSLNKTMALVAIIPLLIMAGMGLIVMRFMHEKFRKRQEAFEAMSEFTQENFSGFSVVKAFVREINELKRFNKINKNNENRNMEFIRLSVLMDIGISLLINTVSLLIIVFGGFQIINKTGFTIGNLTEYVSYFSTLIWPIMALTQLINLASQGYASLKRINALLDKEPSVKNSENAVVLDNVKGKIEFKNLSFAYPSLTNSVLENINLTINPGEKIGVIGRTGCGKTTLVDLLLRMYNVDKGSLFIDDVDIMDIDISSYRKNVSFVPQDNFLFGTKVKDNIAFGKDGSDEDIIEVAKQADVHKDIVDFSDSYDTVLGERGVTVSGGQKQRISIARAFLKKAPIIILDDAVSAVDTKTEDTILKNLHANFTGSTVIVTAHRISTVQDLDKIIVLDEGKVVGFDSHTNLYQNNELYKEMVDLQKLEAKIEGDLNETK